MTHEPIVAPSEDDALEYVKLTKTIKAGLKIFLKVGGALIEIRVRHLYRVEFETWDDYLEEIGLKRQHASRLMRAKQVVSELENEMLPIGNILRLPSNESQVRPLFRLKSPEERSLAWTRAVEAAGDKQPTAEIVSREVRAMLPDAVKSEAKTVERESSGKHGDRETESAVLRDGVQIPGSLWREGYIDAETAQRKLDGIGAQTGLEPEETLSLQRFFIDLVAGLNVLHEEHPTIGMRKGITELFRETLAKLPLVVSKPGDWEVPQAGSE